ncbi:MAG: DEAD/DEAH box helicase family protein [bacterium]
MIQRDAQWCIVPKNTDSLIVWEILKYREEVILHGKKKIKYSSFLDRRGTPKFPYGLTNYVIGELENQGYEVELDYIDFKLSKKLNPKLPGITFEKYQSKLLRKAYLNKRGILVSVTGSGKSLIIGGLIEMYKVPITLVIVPSKSIFSQLADDLKKWFPDYEIGLIGDNECQVGEITVALYQSLRKWDLGQYNKMLELVIVDECFSGDTEILTENGFIRFDKLKDEKVAQYNQNNRKISFIKPIKKIKKYSLTNLLHFKSDNNFDFLITKNHEMLVTNFEGNWVKKCAKDIKKNYYTKMATSGYGTGKEKNLTPFEKFIIAFQADGSFHSYNKKTNMHIAAFSFSKERKINEKLFDVETFEIDEEDLFDTIEIVKDMYDKYEELQDSYPDFTRRLNNAIDEIERIWEERGFEYLKQLFRKVRFDADDYLDMYNEHIRRRIIDLIPKLFKSSN